MRPILFVVSALIAGALATCGPADPFVPEHPVVPAADGGPLLLAGDVAECDLPSGTIATAELLDRLDGTVVALGDLAYPDGGPAAFRDCYHPTWGRHRVRTLAVPGNHEYEYPGAGQYYAYFGAAGGPTGRGYRVRRWGEWTLLFLNSEQAIGPGSRQYEWARAALAAEPTRCTLAVIHRPRFSSGTHGDNDALGPLWESLHQAGVELVVSGHDHHYERFAPQDAGGRADPTGPRQFVVGTGGASLREPVRVAGHSEVRDAASYGVLRLDLGDGRYDWEFIATDAGGQRDMGSGVCR